ncbi:MAG: TenA family protein, partial [Dehalococcoidia bacterium]
LVAGTLPLEKFQRYFLQDYAFLRDFSTLLALSVVKAPNMETARRLATFLAGVLEGEEDLFRRTFRAWGWPEERWRAPPPSPTARAMGDFMVRVAYAGGFAEVMTVLAVTEGVYLDWATRAVEAGREPGQEVYRDWIAIHSNADFTEFVQWLTGVLDATPMADDQRERAGRLFSETLRHELAFWELGYRGEEQAG